MEEFGRPEKEGGARVEIGNAGKEGNALIFFFLVKVVRVKDLVELRINPILLATEAYPGLGFGVWC